MPGDEYHFTRRVGQLFISNAIWQMHLVSMYSHCVYIYRAAGFFSKRPVDAIDITYDGLHTSDTGYAVIACMQETTFHTESFRIMYPDLMLDTNWKELLTMIIKDEPAAIISLNSAGIK
jgi:hypothetical protein